MDQPETAGRDRGGRDLYFWEVPGKPIAVQISYQTMDRMLLDVLEGLGPMLRGRGAEVGGILLGAAEDDGGRRLVRVEDFLQTPCEHAFGPSYRLSENDRQEFSRILGSWRRTAYRRLYAVGFWRSHTRENFALAPEDLELFSAEFAHPDCIALLIRPQGTGPGQAGFFFWEGGRVQAEACYRTFDFGRQVSDRRIAEAPRGGATFEGGTGAAQTRSEVGGIGSGWGSSAAVTPARVSSLTTPDRRGNWRRRFSLVFMALLLMALAAGTVVLAREGLIHFPPTQAWRDPFSLSLGGRDHDGNIQCSWDRDAPPVRLAESALLIITDGDQVRRLELDREQVRKGSVVYRRVTDRVSFRLELLWGPRSLSETWSYEVPLAK